MTILIILPQLMDSGVHGRDGKLVQSPVVVAFRSECEDVTIQLLQMAAETAEEHASRRHFAINRLVQVSIQPFLYESWANLQNTQPFINT